MRQQIANALLAALSVEAALRTRPDSEAGSFGFSDLQTLLFDCGFRAPELVCVGSSLLSVAVTSISIGTR